MFTPAGRRQGAAQGRCPIDFAYAVHSHDRRPLLGRAGQRHDRPAALPAAQRRHHRDHHQPEPEAEQGLAQAGQDRARAHQDPLPAAHRAARQGGRARHRPARQGAAQARHHAGSAPRSSSRTAAKELQLRDRRRADHPGRLRQDHDAAGAREGAARADEEGATSRRPEDREHAEDAAPQGHAADRVVSGIKVAGEEDILVRFAKCCSPLPGDPIVGFITRGRGVTVHRRDCDKGLDLDPERRIDVEWDGNGKAQHEVAIQVLCADKPGLLAHISQSFTDQGVNISPGALPRDRGRPRGQHVPRARSRTSISSRA